MTKALRCMTLITKTFVHWALPGIALVLVGTTALGIADGAFARSTSVPKEELGVSAQRAQKLEYLFVPTGETIPYRLFVPASYDGTTPYPLVVALHGGGQDSDYVMDSTQIAEVAERFGMIVVAPLGYNRFGGYGGSFPIVTTHLAAEFAKLLLVPAAKRAATEGVGQQPPGEDIDAMATVPTAAEDDFVELPSSFLHQPETLDFSEQDVLNVVALVRRDYRIDPDRVYLTGNSMGGMGTQHLAAKHPEMWAAIAPAGLPVAVWSYPFWRLRDNDIAVMYVHGSLDNLSAPRWSAELCQAATKEGVEASLQVVEGGTHISAWDIAMPQIFSFFKDHRRGSRAPSGAHPTCEIGKSK